MIEQCLEQAWYLSADMQFYIVSPPFIYLLYRYKNKIIPVLVAICGASVSIIVYNFIKYDINVKLTDELSNDYNHGSNIFKH